VSTVTAAQRWRRFAPNRRICLFLDIQIDSLNGVGIARALDPNKLPLIVFVTAYDQYALQAFEVSAVDYLLKPFDDDRFSKDPGAGPAAAGGGRSCRTAGDADGGSGPDRAQPFGPPSKVGRGFSLSPAVACTCWTWGRLSCWKRTETTSS